MVKHQIPGVPQNHAAHSQGSDSRCGVCGCTEGMGVVATQASEARAKIALKKLDLLELSLGAGDAAVERMMDAAASTRVAALSHDAASSSAAGAAPPTVDVASAALSHDDATQTTPRPQVPKALASRRPASLLVFMNEFGFDELTSWVDGRTMLHMACDIVDADPLRVGAMKETIIEMIANMKTSFLDAQIRSDRARHWTALHILANNAPRRTCGQPNVKADLIAALSHAKANLEVRMPDNQRTPLLAAAGTQHVAAVLMLLEHKADARAVDIGDQNVANLGNGQIKQCVWDYCKLEANPEAVAGKGRIGKLRMHTVVRGN